MTLGMILNMFSKRLALPNKAKIKAVKSKKSSDNIIIFFISSMAFADSKIDSLIQAQAIPAEHADAFGMLVMQDEGGRMKPVNTLASEVLRKVSRKSSFKGLSPNQVLLGMAKSIFMAACPND